jgi:autotransporter translocation and assembly factor TamB
VPEGLVSAKIAANFTHGADASAIGLEMYDARLRLINTSGARIPKDLPRSSNITMKIKKSEASKSAPSPDPMPEKIKAPHKLQLSLWLKDPVAIRGQGVDMRWTGKISLKTAGDHEKLNGGVQALPGRFPLLGNVFEIETGEVVFTKTENRDPFINLIASTRTSEAVVTAVIRGRFSHPDLVLRSDPPLTQYQIVSLLLIGKSDTADRDGQDSNVEAQAAALLLSFNNPELERKMYDKLGIDRASVSMGQTIEEPIATVGKRVGRKLYIETEYHHNAPAKENSASGSVEYRFTPSWSLETSYGDAQKGEVGLFWQKRFDARKDSGKKDSSGAKKPPVRCPRR